MMPDATKYEQEVRKARKSGGWTSFWEKEKGNGKKRASGVVDEEDRAMKRRKSDEDKQKAEEEEDVEMVEAVSVVEKKGRGRVKKELEDS
jgi:hypothetical protein